MFYTNSKEAFIELEQGRIKERDRCTALKYIFLCPKCSYEFINHKLSENREELTLCIRRILKNSKFSAKLLINYEMLLTESERNHALLSALDSWDAAYELLKHYDLSKEHRKQAIDMILMSEEYTNKFLQHCNSTTEERQLIINVFNDNYSVLQTFIKYIKKGAERAVVFRVLLNDANQIYIAAREGRLRARELKIVYNLHSAYYYNKFKRSFRCYYTYCCTFNGLLSKHEETIMINKLRKAKHKNILPITLEEIKFRPCNVKALHSIIIANKLSKRR